ncbi:unnamed protein product [Calypogeia fissa]
MGGGQGQALATSARLTTGNAQWRLDSKELVEDSDCSENLGFVNSHGEFSSECDPQRTDEDDSQCSAAPCLPSAAPSYEEDSPQLQLRQWILPNSNAFATTESIRQTRKKLNRYIPRSSTLDAQGKRGAGNVIPDMTTLLIVGFKGAGKSSLINNVIRVLSNKPTGYYRAQVSDDPNENGTYFMGEYMLCGGSGRPRVSLFDSRGLPEDDLSTSMALLEGWMKDGVRHGQMDVRSSDNSSTKESIEKRGRHGDNRFSRKKNVNFVIFVVDAVSVFKIKESGDASKHATLVQLYKNPYLTFKDNRPVVAMTHGDKLSHDDRISTQIFLGEILGVPPVEQIFDVSGLNLGWTGTTTSNVTEIEAHTVRDITILNMLTSALDCADRNLPHRKSSAASLKEVFKSMAMNYEALSKDRKVALCGMIICIYILVVLSMTASVSLALTFKKRKWWKL